MQSRHNKHIASRYIEVTEASKLDFNKAAVENDDMRRGYGGYGRREERYDRYDDRRRRGSRSGSGSRSREYRRKRRYSQSSSESYEYSRDELNNMGIMKMRGLPYEAREEEIYDFFGRFQPIPRSLRFGYNREGRKSGEAAVLFETRAQAKDALELDRQRIGNRYIELMTIGSEEFLRL